MFGLDLVSLIKAAGYLGMFGIIFAESGLFFGFFLPGDSLLFTAGFLASQGFLRIEILTVLMMIAAILGDSAGYAFGKKIGPTIFSKDHSFFFNKRYIERSRVFFEKHGKKTIILARFLPAVRTFVPILAGVGDMHYKTFITYNIIGAGIWAAGLTLIGYFFGSLVPNVDRYLLPVVLVIVIVSTLPALYHILGDRETRSQILGLFQKRKK